MGKCIMPQVFVIGGSGGDEPVGDGKTHMFIRSTVVTGKDIVLYLNKSDGSTLTVDWGDSTTSTFTNTGNFNTGTHTYTNYGDYTIKMWISSGSGTYGPGNGNYATGTVGGNTQIQRNMLLKAFVGDNVTSIGGYAFYQCLYLTFVVIPSSVTSIDGGAFNTCRSLKTYVLERTDNITTLDETDAFLYIPSITKIYVPDALVNDYKSATNWSTYADYIYPISEKGVTHND